MENNPDGGDLSFAPQFDANPYDIHTTTYPDTVGFVAETADGTPAGTGFVSFVAARLGGEVRRTAYLNNLAVAAPYRNRGLATRLAHERIELVESRLGADPPVWATIQQGNEPSRAVADSWAEHTVYEQTGLGVEPDTSADTRGYEVREARPEELPRVAERVNAFYADAELFTPYTAEGIRERCARSPVDVPVRRYVVALDGDEVVAGADVLDMHEAMWIDVEGDGDLPPVVPDDGEVRPRSVLNPWFTDGAADAARALVAHLRANPAGANRITFQSGPAHPFAEVLEDAGARPVMRHTTALRGVAKPATD